MQHTHTHCNLYFLIASTARYDFYILTDEEVKWAAKKPWLVFCICAAFLHTHMCALIRTFSYNPSMNKVGRKHFSIVSVTQCVNVNQ